MSSFFFHFMSSISRNPITFDEFHFICSISRNPITFDEFHFMSSFFFLVPSYDMVFHSMFAFLWWQADKARFLSSCSRVEVPV